MLHSRKPSTAVGDHIEIIAYLRRKPELTKAQFYDHWHNIHAKKLAPWAEKAGVVKYQQMQASGTVIPNSIGIESSESISTNDLVQPVRFDGIAIFEVTSLQRFEEALSNEYYKSIIEPDERDLIDKEGFGGGVVARFYGKVWSIVDGGKSKVKVVAGEEMKAWDLLAARKDMTSMQDDGPFL